MNHDHAITRKTFLRLGGAGALGLGLPALLPGSQPRAAGAERFTVDLAEPFGQPRRIATGFLHGLSQDGSRPPAELLLPLKPILFRGGGSTLPGGGWSRGGPDGYRVRWQNVVDRFTRVTTAPLNAEYCIVLSDLWGANGVDITPADPYPGDDGDWSSYELFLRTVIDDVRAAGMRSDQVQLEIWNEPDFGAVYWPRPRAQYEEMWRRGVRLIRQLDPTARIEGPTFTRITTTGNSWHLDEWLDMAVASDTVPDILAWHALLSDHEPVSDAALARRLLAERGLDHVQLEINEYLPREGLDPGYNSWYVARLERARIDYGVLAIYGACCMYPELDGLLIIRDGELVRTPRWWIYQRYASITGSLVTTTPGTSIDGVAGLDSAAGRARILLGNRLGDGSDLGTVSVTVRGLAEHGRALSHRRRIPARLERIPAGVELSEPEVIKDLELPLEDDSLIIEIDWGSADDAYVITLGQQDSELPRMIIAGTRPDPVVLPPGHPTDVTVLLRNFTDRRIVVHPKFTVPAGYRLTASREVTVPPNSDAEVIATVTRDPGAAAGELVVTVPGDSRSITLVPTENWARIAEITASSSHPPSDPANLNDGDTDSAHWGGGGAGGWNDDSAGTFPDTVTATWSEPVTLNHVRLFTLDSAAYPAADWGIRDVDLRIRTDDGWRTVGQVRDNVDGIVELDFPAAELRALQVVILDSNDATHSRLVELEAYRS